LAIRLCDVLYFSGSISRSLDKIINSLRPKRVIWPILIGLAASGFLLYKNFDKESFSVVTFTWQTFVFIVIAILMMAVRDIAYMYRIIVLTDNRLSWRKAFNVIMLWEFSSAISPSVVGGTGPAIFFLHKEGINLGKSTAVVLTAIFLDELFFIISVPLVYAVYGIHIFPPGSARIVEIQYAFFGGFAIILGYTLFLAYALFVNPYMFKSFISWVFLFPILVRWRMRARKSANQMIRTSRELKGKPFSYWLKSFVATVFAWTGRYWVVNFLIIAFFYKHFNIWDQFMIYGRQLSMWIILLISPTPGGSGIAEYIFTDFLSDFIPLASLAVPLAILWRLISYYPYLIIGPVILPGWIKRVFRREKNYKVVD